MPPEGNDALSVGNAPLGDGTSALVKPVVDEAAKSVVETPVVSRDTGETPEAKTARETKEAADAKTALDVKTAADAKTAADKTALDAATKAVTDAKTPEEKTAAEKALADLKAAQGDKPGVAPEKYTDFKLPEGFTLDKAALDLFTPLAKSLNLSQTQAQRLIDFDIARQKGVAENQTKAWGDLLASRLETAKADPEIGGAGYDANVGLAVKALDAFGTPALRKFLNESDAGSHVELIRAFAKIGKAIGNDTVHIGGAAGAATKELSQADRIYGVKK